MTRFVIFEQEPCELCAVWIGPHLHAVRPDGTYGALVIRRENEPDLYDGLIEDDRVYLPDGTPYAA